MLPILLILLTLAACVAPVAPPSPPPARPPARVEPAPPPPQALAWEDMPLAPGGWTWHRDARGSVAMFGIVGAAAGVVVRCDLAERKISLTLPGTVADGATLTVTTSDTIRALPASGTGGVPPYAGAALAAADPLLDRMAFSRGRMRLALAGQAPVIVPVQPEVARTIEDCRA